MEKKKPYESKEDEDSLPVGSISIELYRRLEEERSKYGEIGYIDFGGVAGVGLKLV